MACGRGEMFGEGNAQLPLDNMLMVDRITEISSSGGKKGKGHVIAELDINPDLWFFDCHFPGRPGDAGLPGSRCDVATGGVLPGLDRRSRPRPGTGGGQKSSSPGRSHLTAKW